MDTSGRTKKWKTCLPLTTTKSEDSVVEKSQTSFLWLQLLMKQQDKSTAMNSWCTCMKLCTEEIRSETSCFHMTLSSDIAVTSWAFSPFIGCLSVVIETEDVTPLCVCGRVRPWAQSRDPEQTCSKNKVRRRSEHALRKLVEDSLREPRSCGNIFPLHSLWCKSATLQHTAFTKGSNVHISENSTANLHSDFPQMWRDGWLAQVKVYCAGVPDVQVYLHLLWQLQESALVFLIVPSWETCYEQAPATHKVT